MNTTLLTELRRIHGRFVQNYVDQALVGRGMIVFIEGEPVFSKRFTAAERSSLITEARARAEREFERCYPETTKAAGHRVNGRLWVNV